MKKLLKKMKNEKVAKGRIIGLAGPCYLRDIVFHAFFGAAALIQSVPCTD